MKKTKKQLNKISKTAIVSLGFALLVIMLVFGLRTSWAAWQEPSSPPPQGNTSQLIDIGPDDQAKAGYLRLDPTFDTNNLPPTNITHALEVKGDGAKISTLNVDGNLAVDIDTLYVNSNTQRVGIGTANPLSKLNVEGATGLLVGKATAVNGQAIVASTSGTASHGVYGSSNVADKAGVYGINDTANSYGIWGESGSFAGVYATSADGTGLRAETTSGLYALYAKNNTPAGSYWAGYFSGRLEATDEVIGSKFLPTKLQNSLVPYTAGWKVGEYVAGTSPEYLAFDGTYIWTANSDAASTTNISKIRASNGQKIFDVDLPDLSGVKPLPLNITFDGSYIWVSYRYGANDGYISKIDPSTGIVLDTIDVQVRPNNIIYTFDGTNSYIWASSSTGRVTRVKLSDKSICTYTTGLLNPQGIAFDGTNVWVANNDVAGNLYQLNHSCEIVGSPLAVGSDPISIIFDGASLWVTRKTGGLTTNNLVRVPLDRNTTNYPVIYYSTETDGAFDLTFDGTYIWVTHLGHGHLERVRAYDGVVDAIDYNLGSQPGVGIVFDGTYLWVGHSSGFNTITKLYSGTGFGHTDLSSLVNLQTSTPGTAQTGNFSTSGTGTIDTNLEIGGDLIVNGNTWGGSGDKEIPVSGDGNYTCEYGKNTAGLWHFDENTGLTAYDSTANGNNGTLTNSPTWVPGKIGSSLQFNGTNYVLVSDSSSLDITNEITIEAWVKPNGSGTFRYIVAKPSWGFQNPPYMVIGNDNKIEWSAPWYVDESNKNLFQLFSNATLRDGNWYYVVGTFDSAGNQKIYINGVPDNQATRTPYTLQTNNQSLYIGGDSGGQLFNGVIDEVQISNRAKTATEIQNNYNVDYRSRGSFIKGIEVDASGNLSKILCRPL